MSKLTESLFRAKLETEPWDYHIFGNCLTEDQVEEIRNADIDKSKHIFDGTRSGYTEGQDRVNHKFREYVTKENSHRYPALREFINEMRRNPIRSMIGKLMGRKDDFDGAYVRLEVLNDTQGFWLKPHCDIPEKLISSLIYVNQTAENLTLGTDLYNEKLELVHTVPFHHNFGYIFHGPNKWHGMEKGKEIQVERRGIQLNYVTFETDWPVNEKN
jgi:hypothetical protein